MPVTLHSEREPGVDALRAVALAGVFLVNAVGYGMAPDYPAPVGAPQPVDSLLALGPHGLLVALVQGKAWPLLCFLFGYSLCATAVGARARGLSGVEIVRARYRRLLLLGVLHGTLVYFGDVLTMYALCGFCVSAAVFARARTLLRLWWWLTGLAVVVGLLTGLLGIALWFDWGAQSAQWPATPAVGSLVGAAGLGAFLQLNAQTYLEFQLAWLFTLAPLMLWLTVAGVLARRFRLLGARRFARAFWGAHLPLWHFWAALCVNIALGAASVWVHQSDELVAQRITALATWAPLPGIWLSAATLAVFARDWQNHTPQWVTWLAPAGRHTLVMYLSLSLLLMLSSGAFWAWSDGTLLTTTLALGAWWLAVLLARKATARGWRDPLAQWLSFGARPATAR